MSILVLRDTSPIDNACFCIKNFWADDEVKWCSFEHEATVRNRQAIQPCPSNVECDAIRAIVVVCQAEVSDHVLLRRMQRCTDGAHRRLGRSPISIQPGQTISEANNTREQSMKQVATKLRTCRYLPCVEASSMTNPSTPDLYPVAGPYSPKYGFPTEFLV